MIKMIDTIIDSKIEKKLQDQNQKLLAKFQQLRKNKESLEEVSQLLTLISKIKIKCLDFKNKEN